MLKILLASLFAFFRLAVDPPGDPEPDPAPAPDEPDLPDLDAPDPEPEPEPEPDPDVERAARLAAAERRAEEAERRAAEAAARADALSRAAPPAPSPDRTLFEQEEARLRDPAITATERWQIESNRVLRDNQQVARQALLAAQDSADRAEFSALIAGKPYGKKYEARVEEKLAEIRKGGNNLPRKMVLKILIGDDIVEGKVKTGKKAGEPAAKVARGTPPSNRGDVRARPGNTEREKRRARLEGQTI